MRICIDCGRELGNDAEKCGCINEKENKALPAPVIELFHQSAKSKLLLSAMIVFTLAVALNLFNDWVLWFDSSYNFDAIDYCLNNITNIFSRFGINDGKGMILIAAGCVGGASGFASAIPSIMLVVGMWMLYGSVHDENTIPNKPKGVWMVESMLIIFAGFTFWGVLATIMVSGFFFSSLFDGGATGWEAALTSSYILISPFCQIIIGMFYVNMYRLAHNIRSLTETRTIRTIRPIWGKLAVVFAGLSIILTFVSLAVIPVYPSGIVGTNLVSAVATILFGLFLLSFVERINAFVER